MKILNSIKSHVLPAVLASSLFGMTTGWPQTRGAWEKFNFETNSQYWSVLDFSDSTGYYPTFSQDPDFPEASFIYRLFVDDNGFLFSIFEGNQDYDFFHGDLAEKRIAGFSFDLIVQNAANVNTCDCSFYSVTEGKYYYSPILPLQDGNNSFEMSFEETDWRVFDNGLGEFVSTRVTKEALAHVNDFVVRFFPVSADAGGEAIGLDNFKLVPEKVAPAAEAEVEDSQLMIEFDLWAAQTYSIFRSESGMGLTAFEPAAVAEDIEGTTPYTYSEALSDPQRFFKIQTDIFFTEIPKLPSPPGAPDVIEF